MKQSLLVFLFCSLSFTSSQVRFSKIFEKYYDELPIKIRVDNSGIYGISSFDISGETICLNSFDGNKSYSFNNSDLIELKPATRLNKDFILDFAEEQSKLHQENLVRIKTQNSKYRKFYFQSNKTLFVDVDGMLSNTAGDKIFLSVKSRNELRLDFSFADILRVPGDINLNMKLNFSSNLACSEFIGADGAGNIFLLVEKYISEVPLKAGREVYTISSKGEVLSILEIPLIKYLYTVRDFQIDEEGNLYHMLCEKEKVTIIKWSGLNKYQEEKIIYPAEYNYTIHFNDFVTTFEAAAKTEKMEDALSSREEALRLGEKYVLQKYNCSAANLAPAGVVAPDGDTVKTPSWLINGYNARVPYKWGGFNTITGFLNGINSGKYAGDIDTDGSSSYAVGVDCSGFVSRCWQLTYHASTSYMPGITTQYSSWDSLKPADAIHKVGHVRMFIERTSNGAFRVVESAGRDWDVSYWTFTLSDLSTYTPRYYNNMTNDFSKQQPVLLSAVVHSTGQTSLSWFCDTTGVKGYRLYSSSNGTDWTLLFDENSLQSNSAIVNQISGAVYYRVSSVLNNSPAFSESPWSNVLASGSFASVKRALIVDGFERKTGSWRGNQHTFVMQYGKSLASYNMDFASVKNSLVENNSINMKDYEVVFWILGDESTENETFNPAEQNKIKDYLENGGKLFVSGSEIGWDLFEKGNSTDRAFYNQYLKAAYISDDAASNAANGVNGSCFSGVSFNFGQTYYEDYPDEINSFGGSVQCMRYTNNKGAAISYTGSFGSSIKIGKLIYLAFPLESTANDTAFNSVISNSLKYFYSGNVKLIVEGLYNPALNKLNMRDTIKAYLRNISSPYVIKDSSKSLIDSVTFNCTFQFFNAPSGNYYIMIKHRNSLETWSKNGGIFFMEGTSPDYDFTFDSSQAFVGNMKLIAGKWTIFSGDVNQDGLVNSTDLLLIDNNVINFSSGYLLGDITGDDFVDLNDMAICDNNVYSSVHKITPETSPLIVGNSKRQASENK